MQTAALRGDRTRVIKAELKPQINFDPAQSAFCFALLTSSSKNAVFVDNPRRECAQRVTEVCQCVCLSVTAILAHLLSYTLPFLYS